jgi:hypothetical protein
MLLFYFSDFGFVSISAVFFAVLKSPWWFFDIGLKFSLVALLAVLADEKAF